MFGPYNKSVTNRRLEAEAALRDRGLIHRNEVPAKALEIAPNEGAVLVGFFDSKDTLVKRDLVIGGRYVDSSCVDPEQVEALKKANGGTLPIIVVTVPDLPRGLREYKFVHMRSFG